MIGLLAALWSASGYVGAFMRASNAIYDIEEGRRSGRRCRCGWASRSCCSCYWPSPRSPWSLTGGLAERIGDVVGLGSTAVAVWDIAKWPVLLIVVSFMFALLYWAAPNVKQPGFRWVSRAGCSRSSAG